MQIMTIGTEIQGHFTCKLKKQLALYKDTCDSLRKIKSFYLSPPSTSKFKGKRKFFSQEKTQVPEALEESS